MIGCYLLSSMDYWDKNVPVAKSKLSASILNSVEVFGDIRTGVLVMAIFSVAKVYCWSSLQN